MQRLAIAACLFGVTLPAFAEEGLIVPPKDGFESACEVTGLNPDGDGFLAVRRGPGSQYAQIGSLYNGDHVSILRECSGNWCFADQVWRADIEQPLKGWLHMNWCNVYAG